MTWLLLAGIAALLVAFWLTVRNNERLRAGLNEAGEERQRLRNKLALTEDSLRDECARRGKATDSVVRENLVLAQKLEKKDRELTDICVLHEAQRAERKSILADMQQNYGARVTTEAQVQYAATLVPLIERTAEAVAALAAQSNQREANLRNDVEAERVLAAKSLDSLTQMGTHLVTLSTEMAGLQRIGFRPPTKETDQPKDSIVVGMPSIDDVDRELMEADEKLVARDD